MDKVRELIAHKLDEKRLSMKDASLEMGHAHSYLYQFLKVGSPRELHERDRAALASVLGVTEDDLRGPSSPIQKRESLQQYLTRGSPGELDKVRELIKRKLDEMGLSLMAASSQQH